MKITNSQKQELRMYCGADADLTISKEAAQKIINKKKKDIENGKELDIKREPLYGFRDLSEYKR